MPQAELSKQQQLIAALLDPAIYPHQAKTVRLIETHISWVLLAGRYAYKIKKALDLGFLDATKLASRRHYCSEEIRLNRRLAPQLYLGVIPIGCSHAHPAWNVLPAIEYAVKMRRFTSSKTLDHLIDCGKISAPHIDALADTLAQFHAALPSATSDSNAGSAATIHSALEQNFAQLAGLPSAAGSAALAALQQASEGAYSACKQRLEERKAQGFVRECHGDLHLGNIALIGNKPVPFDGIDFNPALRWIDVMDEIAFLFMDLLHHRRPDLAYRFLNAYLEQTGDYARLDLLNFYCAYRATVRAKVNAIRANQTGLKERSRLEAVATCRDYLNLANECLKPHAPRLIITHGLPGSGKTTFAQAALERMGAIRLRSDVERKRLFGLSALDNSRALSGHDIYSADATRRTYAHLLASARALLAAGHTVIVDAAFLKRDEREMFRKLAQEMRAPFAIASMQTSEANLRSRILTRQARYSDASEADLGVLQKLQTSQEVLLPQEMSCTAIFVSDDEKPFRAEAWSSLDELLRGA